MAKILITYATSEGQTAKISLQLAVQLEALGHEVFIADLSNDGARCDPTGYAAVIIAASVHGGRHQTEAIRFVKAHRAVLQEKLTGFVSVSMSAAADEQAGQRQAQAQVESFLATTDWHPDLVEPVAGAFRLSGFSRCWRWIIRAGNALFRHQLKQLGWPQLNRDQELTDWDALQRFAGHFSARLSAQSGQNQNP